MQFLFDRKHKDTLFEQAFLQLLTALHMGKVCAGDRASSIVQGNLGIYLQDNYKVRPNLTLELGLRYDWNMSPTERFDRFVVFDPHTDSLVRVGTGFDQIYHTNNKNFQPRVGVAWDPFKDGKTSVRAAYGVLVDQPVTNVVTGPTGNPPLATPLNFNGAVRLDNAFTVAGAAGLAPATVDQGFDNAYVQSWNLNLQREVMPGPGVTIGYFGSKGTHLRISRNINQPVNGGARPFPTLSLTSPIRPGAALGNITEIDRAGNSSYNALWVNATKRLARGFQFNASYTFSKSIDYNSLNSQGVIVQDSNNIRNSRGLSDYDARHRFVVSSIYELPFKGNRLVEGWQLSTIIQSQSGNPVNLITGINTFNGVANTLRPDVTGPITYPGAVEQWFNPSVFVNPTTPTTHFGSLGRNVVIGPRFNNADFSIIKNTKLNESMRVQFRKNFLRSLSNIGSHYFLPADDCRATHGKAAPSRKALDGNHRQTACSHRRSDGLPEGRQRRRRRLRDDRRHLDDVGHALVGRRDAGSDLQPAHRKSYRHQRARRRADPTSHRRETQVAGGKAQELRLLYGVLWLAFGA